jgi:hypothetical protein
MSEASEKMPGMADSQESSKLTRQEISDAVTGLGWRHILGAVQARVRVARPGPWRTPSGAAALADSSTAASSSGGETISP